MAKFTVRRLTRDYLTFEQAAAEYNVSVTCLRRATKDPVNPLPFCKPAGQTRGYTIRRSDLEKWLDSCMVNVGAQA